ncbi:MAG: glutamine--fructose-6-phosphate transaminase (isomerizing) [Thalassobaculales bacterium]
MCGIVGVLARREAAPLLLDGLRRLEYRGYDSAGLATVAAGRLDRRRAAGRLGALQALLDAEPLAGRAGIGHTRWATHGEARVENAHPLRAGRVAIVHNGIIENFAALRTKVEAAGRRMEGATDTEVVAHLIDLALAGGATPEAALAGVMPRLSGAFSFAILIEGEEDAILVARRGTPLAVGLGDGEAFVASDAIALAPLTRRIVYLEDGDHGVVRRGRLALRDRSGAPVERKVTLSELTGALVGRGNHRHFMEKEIFEQPEVLGATLRRHLTADGRILMPELPLLPRRILAAACGTAFLATRVAQPWFEDWAGLPADGDIASELRYRGRPVEPGTLGLAVSQSGETLDTLEAMRGLQAGGTPVLAVVNVPESTMAREADVTLPTQAGPEIGVASTKAFLAQLASLALLAARLARGRGADMGPVLDGLAGLPSQVAGLLADAPVAHARAVALRLAEARSVFFLGRGGMAPIAAEGALKLKELAYIHAEGLPAGELKHGPIALIDESMPVVVAAAGDRLIDKLASNVQQVAARGGRIILVADPEAENRLGHLAEAVIPIPAAPPGLAPILAAVPMQLLAYHAAVARGTDVDQPRNLAKAVTVE